MSARSARSQQSQDRLRWPEGRNARVAVGAGGGILVLALLLGGASQTSLMDIERVDVSGASHYQAADIVAKSGLRLHSPIISVNAGRVTDRLTKDPWIATANVDRHWPHVVKIAVAERRAVAIVQTGDKWVQVSADGVVLAVMDGPSNDLPVPLGVQAQPNPGSHLNPSANDLLTVAASLPPSLAPAVSQMQKDDKGEFRLGLRSGGIVELGDLRDLADKLTSAASIVSQTNIADVGILDVRSPHLPVATPKSATTTIAPPPTAPAANSATPTTTAKPGAKSKTSTTTTLKKSVPSTTHPPTTANPG